MEKKSLNKEAVTKINRAYNFLEEWKRRRTEDEKKFLQEINTPEHKKKMEVLRGKTIKNGIVSNS